MIFNDIFGDIALYWCEPVADEEEEDDE